MRAGRRLPAVPDVQLATTRTTADRQQVDGKRADDAPYLAEIFAGAGDVDGETHGRVARAQRLADAAEGRRDPEDGDVVRFR